MKTVLIVEDDMINARVFSKILTKRGGLAVKHTENVEEVIQIAESGEVDVILMDVSLSHSLYQGKPVDGIRITQMLKAKSSSQLNYLSSWLLPMPWMAIGRIFYSKVVLMAIFQNPLWTIKNL